MDDELYKKARHLLMQQPEIGKNSGGIPGVHPPMGRRLKERFRGEREGHRTDVLYQQFLALKALNPTWGSARVARAMNIKLDIAALLLARFAGVTTRLAPTTAPFIANTSGGDFVPPIRINRNPTRDENTHLNIPEVLSGMLERFREAAPSRPAVSYSPQAEGMLEMSLMDLHLGKLAWAPETGRHYDPDTAEQMFWTALEDLLAKAAGCRPEKILFVAGNDFFNTDCMGRTTTAGTAQDDGLTWKEGFIRGRALLVRAIERLRQIAPVHVTCVNGNHDTARIFYLGEVLSAWFSRTAGVIVDNAPSQRKYVHYGANLLGFTHGNNERIPNLPLLMASEQPQAWAGSRHREWHLGHWHHKLHKMFLPVAEVQGVLVRVVPSLSPADSWHCSMGYNGKLAAEAYYWHPKDGCVATFTHSPA